MTRAQVALDAGQQLETRTIGPITQTDIVRFAGAGGDFNPLHHDPDYARAAGLPGVIAMGQMQAGMLAAWIADLVASRISCRIRCVSPHHWPSARRWNSAAPWPRPTTTPPR